LSEINMPIRAAPYAHQQSAYEFALRLIGLEGGDAGAPCTDPV